MKNLFCLAGIHKWKYKEDKFRVSSNWDIVISAILPSFVLNFYLYTNKISISY